MLLKHKMPMKHKNMINWPDNIEDAKEVQEVLRKQVRIVPLKRYPETIAGVDAAFHEGKVIAVAVLYDYPGLAPIDESEAVKDITFPYIPGFLSFREGPAVICALEGLEPPPDIIMFDGQGIAHPKRLGIAAHIGTLLGIPTIGCAKSRLVGSFKEPGPHKGDRSPLIYKDCTVGSVLRSRDRVRPLFISPGHLIDIDGAVDIVLKCTLRYRLPEPTRMADRRAAILKRGFRS